MSSPLVVNTADGTVWTRRSVTRGGLALYAMADVVCPEIVMATLPELAEHGIAGSADVLPMPVGPKPLVLSEQQIEALAEAGNRVVNNAVHQDLCMCDAWPEKCLSSGNYHMGDWDVSGLEDALPAVIGLWESMRSDVLAELLRTAEAYAARLEVRLAEVEKTPFSLGEAPIAFELTEKAAASVDKLTRLFATTQALREEKTTPAGTEVTPTGPTGRAMQLLDAIRIARGEWPVHRVVAFYRDSVPALRSMPVKHLKNVARSDLRGLHKWGHLDRDDPTGARCFYTLKTSKDDV